MKAPPQSYCKILVLGEYIAGSVMCLYPSLSEEGVKGNDK